MLLGVVDVNKIERDYVLHFWDESVGAKENLLMCMIDY
jgi:hypothetical protein